MKESFVIPIKWRKRFKNLKPEDGYNLLMNLFNHEAGEDEKYLELSDAADMAFDEMTEYLDYNSDKYDKKCAKNRENANKRWNHNKRNDSVDNESGEDIKSSGQQDEKKRNGRSPNVKEKERPDNETCKGSNETCKGSNETCEGSIETCEGSSPEKTDQKMEPCEAVNNEIVASDNRADNANVCERISKNANHADYDFEYDFESEYEYEKEKGAKAPKEKARARYFDNGWLNERYKDWIAYKERLGDPLSSRQKINASIERLTNHSRDSSGNFDPVIAVKVIKQAMDNGWQNFFPLDKPRARSGTKDANKFIDFSQRSYSQDQLQAIEMAARG